MCSETCAEHRLGSVGESITDTAAKGEPVLARGIDRMVANAGLEDTGVEARRNATLIGKLKKVVFRSSCVGGRTEPVVTNTGAQRETSPRPEAILHEAIPIEQGVIPKETGE